MRRAGEGDVATLRAGVPPDTPAPVLHALLASGRLDVGLVHQPADATGPVPGPEVSVELGVVLSRTSPPAGAPEVALGEPARHDLVLDRSITPVRPSP
ncbi:hypothetical protein ACFXBB_00550 [Streptomyces scopuliridis]|uniref:hypothetical protein n=1 Tax=Streptomyces scopuliridis TaxID=452529 RepID=UPI0036BA8A3D